MTRDAPAPFPEPPAETAREAFAYEQTPRPVGFPITFRLKGKALEVERMGRVDRLPLERVREVRLTYAPASFAPGRREAKLKLDDGRSVALSSVTYRAMFDARRQDAAYGRFLRELLRRTAKAAPEARFVAGRPWPIWIVLAVVSLLIVGALAVFALEIYRIGETAIALVAVAVALLGVWQLEPMVRLNKPRDFSPDDPPESLAPRP
ncbi:hypothetical protein [Salinarimonas rosea]|uniref:hypothetical protein n=1 Tax=Salinarimonas rosea TaxID=552063 RepID=UPI0003FE2D40|nr:hypothetical protein [Salinarimonas rosea]